MYIIHKIILGLLFIVLAIMAYCLNLKVGQALSGNLFTLVSILFGFTMSTSVAMRGTDFLYQQSRIAGKSKWGIELSNAQRLCKYIYFASVIDMTLLVVLIINHFPSSYEMLVRLSSAVILGLVGVVIYVSLLLLRIVLKFILS